MKYEEFSAIYSALKSISSDDDLSKDDVIKKIQEELQDQDKASDAYKEWEKGNFSLDHVFTTDGFQPKDTLLIRACRSGDLKVVDSLLKAGASVNVAAGNENPFTVAIEKEWQGSKEDAKAIVDLLIGKVDAHVSAADENVNNTIVKAVERGNLRVFKDLVAKGASLDIGTLSGTLLQWAEMHKDDPNIKKEDMDKIIDVLKAPSEEKKRTDSEIATSTNTDETSGKISLKERDAEYALKCQIEEIAQSTGANVGNQTAVSDTASPAPTANLPDDKKKGTVVNNAATTPANSSEISPAPTAGNTTPGKNDTTFWSEHKGKIALGVTGLCVAGAVAAYVLAYPAVALALAVLAAVILMGAGIAKVLEDPSVEKPFTQQQGVY